MDIDKLIEWLLDEIDYAELEWDSTTASAYRGVLNYIYINY